MAKKEIKWGNKELPGLSFDELNEMSNAKLARQEYMIYAHANDPERKKKSSESGKKNIAKAKQWHIDNPEASYEMKKAAALNMYDISSTNKIGIFQEDAELRSEWCSLGGSANTEAQKEARTIQVANHFRPAGTKAAAIIKKEQYNKYQLEFYNLIEIEGWFTIKEVQHLTEKINYLTKNKIEARSTLNKRSDLFKRKEDNKQYYKKIN